MSRKCPLIRMFVSNCLVGFGGPTAPVRRGGDGPYDACWVGPGASPGMATPRASGAGWRLRRRGVQAVGHHGTDLFDRALYG